MLAVHTVILFPDCVSDLALTLLVTRNLNIHASICATLTLNLL